MKKFLAVWVLLFAWSVTQGEPARREDFQPDPNKMDIYLPHLKRLPLSGWWKLKRVSNDRKNNPDDAGQKGKYYAPDYNDSGWEKDLVPNDIHTPFLTSTSSGASWSTLIRTIPQEIREWGGVAYFRKDFTVPAIGKNERAILFLDEVAGAFTLYVNGKKIAPEQPYFCPVDYIGPQKSHMYDVTDAIKPQGKNNITIRLFHNGDPVRWGWAGRAGIMDRVYLDIRPAAYTANIMVTPQADLKNADFDCIVSGSDAPEDVQGWQGDIFEWNSGKTVAKVNFGAPHTEDGLRMISGRGEISKAKLWSWQSPFLYGIKVKNRNGEVVGAQRFGMRTMGVKNGDFVLNGKPVMLRGICMGATDIPMTPGVIFADRTNYDNAYRKEWEMYTKANINHWRMHSSMPNRAYCEVTDELGIIVTNELGYPETKIKNPERADMIDVKGLDGACDSKGNLLPEFRQYNKDRIRRLYSHPSICTFSFGNEIRQYDDPRVENLLNSLYALYHQVDKQQRPVTNSSGRFWKDASNVEEMSKREKLDYIDTHDYTGSINNYPIGYCEPVILNLAKAIEKYYGKNAPPVVNGETVYMAPHYFPKIFDGIWKTENDPQPNWDKMLYMLNQWRKDEPQNSFLAHYWVRNWGSKNYKYKRDLGRGIYLERIIEAHRKTWPLRDGYEILSGPYFARSEIYPFDRMHFTPNAAYRYLAQVNAPVVAVLDYIQPNRFAGEALKTQVYVINNSENDLNSVQFEAVIEQNGKTISSRQIQVDALPSNAKKIYPLEMTTPSEPGEYQITYRLRQDGKIINERELPLYILGRAAVFQPITTDKKIGLYDVSAVFGNLKPYSTIKMLKKFNVPHMALRSFDKLSQYDAVIIGNNSIDGKIAEGAEQLRAYVENGGRLLVFDQNYVGRIPFLPELEYALAGPGQFTEVLKADHPALQGLEQKNFFCWNQGDWSIYRTYISPVSRAALTIGGDTTQWGSDHFGMVSAHLKLGKGDILFCQAEVTKCLDQDSGAARFARRLLETILNDQSRDQATTFTGLPIPKNKPITAANAGCISLKTAANMGFADEVAKDGKGGWTDQGAGNDLAPFPTGKVIWGKVPFEIIDPKTNNNRSCVVVNSNPQRLLPAKSAPIAIGAAMKRLVFLHASAWTPGKGKKLGQYVVTYESGRQTSIPLVSQNNIGDWWNAPSLPVSQAICIWSAMNKSGVVGIYMYEWQNPLPGEPIKNIVLQAEDGVIGLVGLTGEKNNQGTK